MKKNLLKQEKGVALTIGAIVTVVLFLIATALFISTQSESTKSLADKAGGKAIDVANAGAERALWYVQQELDNNPNWQPTVDEVALLKTEYDYFENLTRYKKNPDEYAKMCIQVGLTEPGETSGSIGGVGSQVYAVKLRRGPDERALGDNIWSICSLGIDRTASILGGEGAGKMEIRGAKVIVQLGTMEGMPDTPVNTPGNVQTTEGQRIHIGGPPLPGGPVVKVGDWNDHAPLATPNDSRFKAQNPQPPQQPRGWGDGWYKKDGFKMEKSQTGPPDLPLHKVGLPGSGAEIVADYYIDLNNPNYNTDTRDLRHNNNGWTLIKNKDGSQTLIPPYIGQFEGDFREIGLFGRNVDQSLLSPGGRALYDVNGDGYTVIYTPPGNTNIRIYNLTIMPEVNGDVTRAMIVSRGTGSNLYDGADSYGYVHLPAASPFPDDPIPGERLIAADQQRNSYTGIDIRGVINHYNITSFYSFWDFIWDDVNKEMRLGSINYGEVEDINLYKLDRRSGSLSLLADYDIILSTPDADDGGDPGDPQSIFRGLIYSKRDVIFQEDFLLRGAVMGGRNIDFVDQSGLWPSQRGSGDGFDIAICHENAFRSSDGTRNILHDALRPAGGGTGNMQVLDWENIKGWKQIQNTF